MTVSLQSPGSKSIYEQDIFSALPASVLARIAADTLFPQSLPDRWPKKLLGEVMLLLAKVWVRRQRPEFPNQPPTSHQDVRALYDSESKRYLQRHARTTCRQDDVWRLWLGQALVSKIREVNAQQKRPARHLELFAGSGLSYSSQAKVFHLHDVAVNTILLDASAGMLDVAAKLTIPQVEHAGHAVFVGADMPELRKQAMRQERRRTVEIVQSDPAGNGAAPVQAGPSGRGLLSEGSHDLASIMFGLGAIPLAKAVSLSHDLLHLLTEGGRFAVTAMHKPVAHLAGRWAWPAPVTFRWAWLEREAYKRITVPYVLRQLWGWYDPSLYPHLMKLSVIKTEGLWYGWEEVLFELQSHSWDFGMPMMPVYRQILVKVRLSEHEATERANASQAILSCLAEAGESECDQPAFPLGTPA